MKTHTKVKIIADCVCGCVVLLSCLVYILVGFLTNIWHPTWLIVVGGGFICCITDIIINAVYKFKDLDIQRDENGDK